MKYNFITQPTHKSFCSLDIPTAIFRLATNSVYVVTTIGYCVIMFIVNGFTTFLPKYIENQFQLTPTLAGIPTGTMISFEVKKVLITITCKFFQEW